MADYQQHGGGGSSGGPPILVFLSMILIGAIAFIALVVGSVAVSKANSAHSQLNPSDCDPTGYFMCNEGSYCVGTKSISQGSDNYYQSGSNGLEFDHIAYLPIVDGGAPTSYFLHMTIHGGCTKKPCSFHENELYTGVPGSVLNFEGFTVNRTGAVDGQQVFYENLYFDSSCNAYTKIVKGQQVGSPLAPAAVLCRNMCERVSEDIYQQGIQGGYTPP